VPTCSVARRRLSSSAERLRRLQGQLLQLVEHERHITGACKASVLQLPCNRCVLSFAAGLGREETKISLAIAFCILVVVLGVAACAAPTHT
jgi:hypothetical protein